MAARIYCALIAFTCMVQTPTATATTIAPWPVALVHACVSYKDGSLIVSEDGLKVARIFANVVADHLTEPKDLSLAIFRGKIDQPKTTELTSVREPTAADLTYVEKIFGYEIGRITGNGGRLTYLRASIDPRCGIEGLAAVDASLSGALCGQGSQRCEVECTATGCRRKD